MKLKPLIAILLAESGQIEQWTTMWLDRMKDGRLGIYDDMKRLGITVKEQYPDKFPSNSIYIFTGPANALKELFAKYHLTKRGRK